MARPKVLLTTTIHPSAMAVLELEAEVSLAPRTDPGGIRQAAVGVDGILCRNKLPDDIFEAAPSVRAVARHGIGVDLIPMAEASAHAVPVTNVPGANTYAVAEHALGLMLMISRRLAQQHIHLLDGDWGYGWAFPGRELRGKCLGLVGVGGIGTELARICGRGFGMRVIGTKRNLATMPEGVEPADIDTVFREADFAVVACPLDETTRHLVDERLIGLMKREAVLVNIARGPVVDETALIAALEEHRIGGAGLDVFEIEPLPETSPLRRFENVVLTPHASGLSQESYEAIGVTAATDLLAALRGERPKHLVNPEVWERHLERLGSGG
jgi:D-3-phosphoglycerate dehydrogenase / 2-oxoglutarate reductase